jgi:hypothetical protein
MPLGDVLAVPKFGADESDREVFICDSGVVYVVTDLWSCSIRCGVLRQEGISYLQGIRGDFSERWMCESP